MSAPCVICGLPGEPVNSVRAVIYDEAGQTRIEWVPAQSPGVACSPECSTLLFVRPGDTTPDEKRLTSWRWRRRRAEARGLPFSESAPMDEAERAMLLRGSPRGQP